MTDLEDLRVLARRIPQARRRMYENLPGYGTGGDGPSGNSISNRTMALALKNAGDSGISRDMGTMASDIAVKDLAALDRLAPGNSVHVLETAAINGYRITTQLNELHAIIKRWDLTPQAQAHIRTGGKNLPTCKSHARIGVEVEPRSPGSALCQWCYVWHRNLTAPDGDWAMDIDMPTVAMVQSYVRDGKLDHRTLPPRRKVTS